VQLVSSSGGRFEVSRDGVPIFQKSRVHRHPAPGEILRLLDDGPTS
jgi:predicted Rdx family selenoprotein